LCGNGMNVSPWHAIFVKYLFWPIIAKPYPAQFHLCQSSFRIDQAKCSAGD
jgi:hypothetical protein